MKNLFSDVDLNHGDVVMVASDVLKVLMHNNKSSSKIDLNLIIDMLLEKISSRGTLLFPTFNWDFCKGKDFNYKKTKSLCGALSNIALRRSDFTRTKNPIYSFAVAGKDKKIVCNMEHMDCFSMDSPFGYLIKNKAKNLFINLHYRFGGFPFVHLVEQELNVNYRYKKYFKSSYIDNLGNKKKATYSMFVRKIHEGVGETFIKEDFDDILRKNNAYKEQTILDNIFDINIINLDKAYQLLKDNFKKDGGIVYSAKL